MVATPPIGSRAQYETGDNQAEVTSLVAESRQDSEIALEFLYTRDIEFRQETLYFAVIDRFFDGDPGNNEARIQHSTIPNGKTGASIGAAICKV